MNQKKVVLNQKWGAAARLFQQLDQAKKEEDPKRAADALKEYQKGLPCFKPQTALHITPHSKRPELGDLVKFYTPDGYMAGTVVDGHYPDFYQIELKSDDIGRLITIEYIYSSRAYGPHWEARPDYESYKLKSRADWERLEAIFPYGWQRDCIISEGI